MEESHNQQDDHSQQTSFEGAHEELRRQRDMLKSIIESLTHPFFVVDVRDLSVMTANSAAYKMAANFKDIKCYALLQGSHKRCGTKEHPCPIDSVMQTKKPVVIEHLCHGKNGHAKHVEIHAYPVFNESGDVTGVIEYWLDVTERELAEEQIISMARFLSENPNPVIRISIEGEVLYANAAGEVLLKDWNCEVGQKVPLSWRQYVARILDSGKSEELELGVGNIVYDLTVTAVPDAGYVNVYGIDITGRKQAEEDLRKYREHLEELVQERTEELTRANEKLRREIEQRKGLEREILNISEAEQRRIGQELHDSLGQQLTGVAFMTRVLEQKLTKKLSPEAADVTEILKLVNQAANQARGLAKGLHPVDLDSGSLVSSIQELASSTQQLFGIKCSFHCNEKIDLKQAQTAVHLYRIAQEAVTNAIKHGRTKKIQIRLTRADNRAVLVIENDGRDFPAEFEKRGTGMGLQIMDHRVDLIAGELTVRRGPKGGTIITCSFPVEQAGGRSKINKNGD